MTQHANDCSILIHGEMQDGIREYGLFNSPYEGLGVILVELEGLKKAVLDAEGAFQDFKAGIHDNDLEASCQEALEIAGKSKNVMIEAMQVAAMARKYVKTFKN